MQIVWALVCFTLARIFRVLQLPFHWCDGGLHWVELKLTMLGAAAWKRTQRSDLD